MARLELPASLLLLAPAGDDKTPAGAEEGSEPLGFSTVDSFEAIHTPPGDLKDARYSIDVSDLLHEGNSKVYRGTLSVDGRRHRNADVVCKLARGKTSVEALHREADLYRGRLAPLQGRCVPTFIGLFRGEKGNEERACLVLTYEGAVMQQSLYTSTIDFRCVPSTYFCLILPRELLSSHCQEKGRECPPGGPQGGGAPWRVQRGAHRRPGRRQRAGACRLRRLRRA